MEVPVKEPNLGLEKPVQDHEGFSQYLDGLVGDFQDKGLNILDTAWADLIWALAQSSIQHIENLSGWSSRSRKRHLQEIANGAFADMGRILREYSIHVETPANFLGNALTQYIIGLSEVHDTLAGNKNLKVPYSKLVALSVNTIYFPNLYNGLRAMGLGDIHALAQLESFMDFIEGQWEILTDSTSDEKLKQCQLAIKEEHISVIDFSRKQYEALNSYLLTTNEEFLDHLIEKENDPSLGRWYRQQNRAPIPVSKARISYLPKEWCIRQREGIDRLHMHSQLLAIKRDLKEVSVGLVQEIKSRFFNPLKHHIHDLEKGVAKLQAGIIEQADLEPTPIDPPDLPAETGINVETALKEVQEKLELSEPLVKIVEPQAQEKFWQGELKQVPYKQIRFSDWINYLIKTRYQAGVQNRLREIPTEVEGFYHELRDCIRLVSYSLGNKSDGERHIQHVLEVIEKSKKDLHGIEHNVNLKLKEIEEHINDQLTSAKSALNTQELQRVGERFRRDLRESGGFKYVKSWQLWIRQALAVQQERLGLLYGKTREDLAAADFEYHTRKNQNPYARLQDFVETVSPNPGVLEAIPFYYKELFVGKSDGRREEMLNRNRELKMAQSAIRRISNKVGGGILVIGHHGAGKTFFCENIAHNEIEGKVFRIEAPSGGSISTQAVELAIQEAVGETIPIQRMMADLPLGSVFIFDDIELWWERGGDAYDCLAYIGDLIDTYGKDHYFICSCNLHFFEFIQQVHPLANHFTSTIQLSPFSPEQVGDVILNLHHAGGLGLNMKGKPVEDISRRRIGKFLRRYHSLSKGNVGIALHMWLANIIDIQKGVINMGEARETYMPEVLSNDQLVQFAQLFLHKHIHLDKLKRLYIDSTAEELEDMLTDMLRTQLVVQVAPEAYGVNPYVYYQLLAVIQGAKLL